MPTVFFADKQALVDYIVANINTNGSNDLTGAELNAALLGALNFVREETTSIFKLTEDTDYLQMPDDTTAVKVWAPGRVPDNDVLPGDPDPAGYSYDATTFRINFASTRVADEIFTVDIIK